MKSAVLERSTRDRVARVVLEDGPVSAAAVAARLDLTPQAVRRHLEALVAGGLVAEHTVHPPGPRGRGRPARSYHLTDAGHAAMSTAYDDLATSALRFLAEESGPEAVERFAQARVADLERRYAAALDSAGPTARDRAEALAAALSVDGFAASARPVADSPLTPHATGVQLCQGHCPVQHVAAEFPQLCEAETQVFSRLLGVHVQRLATLAHGEHVCTTFIPDRTAVPDRTDVPHPLADRSAAEGRPA